VGVDYTVEHIKLALNEAYTNNIVSIEVTHRFIYCSTIK